MANVVVDLYARGVVRSAVDEGARAGATVDTSPADCERRARDVLANLLVGRGRTVGARVVPRGRRCDAGAGPGDARRVDPRDPDVVVHRVRVGREGASARDGRARRVRVRRHRARPRHRSARAPGGVARADPARLVGTPGDRAGHQPRGRPTHRATGCATSARPGRSASPWRATSVCPPSDISVDVSCTDGAELVAGSDVEARVTVRMPAVELPGARGASTPGRGPRVTGSRSTATRHRHEPARRVRHRHALAARRLCLVLFALGGISLDLWRAFSERRALAATADAAALAGASAVDEARYRASGAVLARSGARRGAGAGPHRAPARSRRAAVGQRPRRHGGGDGRGATATSASRCSVCSRPRVISTSRSPRPRRHGGRDDAPCHALLAVRCACSRSPSRCPPCAPRAPRRAATASSGPTTSRAGAQDLGAGTFPGGGLPSAAPATVSPYEWDRYATPGRCVVFGGPVPPELLTAVTPLPGLAAFPTRRSRSARSRARRPAPSGSTAPRRSHRVRPSPATSSSTPPRPATADPVSSSCRGARSPACRCPPSPRPRRRSGSRRRCRAPRCTRRRPARGRGRES